jgi:diacylglycerol kinase (ATP)
MTSTLVIVNPKSQGGRTARAWPDVEAKLREAIGPVRVEWTVGRRDAERVAREGVVAGATRVLVAGGDGTASEAASGILRAGLGEEVELGLLPMGTGRDLARVLGFHGDLDAAIDAIAAGSTRCIDMGRVTAVGGDDDSARYFLNIASFGITGQIIAELSQRDERANRTLLSYVSAAVPAILGWQNPPARVTVDGIVVHDGPIVFATAANGRYFGGGMLVAPLAELDDGLLDVVVVRGRPRASLLARFHKIYAGTHLDSPDVTWLRGTSVVLEPSTQLWTEADGEALFDSATRVEILPSAIRVFVKE